MNCPRWLMVLAVATALAGSASASPVQIVRWYDDYHSTPNYAAGKDYRLPLRDSMGQFVSHSIDVDGNPLTSDSVVWWNFSMTTPLTPVLPSQAPSATYRADRPSASHCCRFWNRRSRGN